MLALVFAVAAIAGGCADDPWSKRRIAIRTQRINEHLDEIEQAEARRAIQLRDRVNEIGRWYRRDQVRFRDRVQRLGDYVW